MLSASHNDSNSFLGLEYSLALGIPWFVFSVLRARFLQPHWPYAIDLSMYHRLDVFFYSYKSICPYLYKFLFPFKATGVSFLGWCPFLAYLYRLLCAIQINI